MGINEFSATPTRVPMFRYWCQKVLPAVYDDSLSYYELLCKVTAKLNEVIESNNLTVDAVIELQKFVDELNTYVRNFFTSPEWEEQIRKNLDEMLEDGRLLELIESVVGILRVFDTTTEALEDLAIGVDDIILTKGYSSVGDGGGFIYQAKSADYNGLGVGNERIFLAVDATREINAKAIGFKTDGSNNKQAMDAVCAYQKSLGNNPGHIDIMFPAGIYRFTATDIDCVHLYIHGVKNSRERARTAGATMFAPFSDNQEYIITFGLPNTDASPVYGGASFSGNAIEDIEFTTVKPSAEAGQINFDNCYEVGVAFRIARQYMFKGDNVNFLNINGTALALVSSYEMTLGDMFFRRVYALDRGVIRMETNLYEYSGTTSNLSTINWNYVSIEEVVGSLMFFEQDCSFLNNSINALNFEDRAFNWGGASWTSYQTPDVNVGILELADDGEIDLVIGNMTLNNCAHRTYTVDNVKYSHDTILKCQGGAKKIIVSIGQYVIDGTSADMKSVIYNQNGLAPNLCSFTIGDAYTYGDNDIVLASDGFMNYSVRKNYTPRDIKLNYKSFIDNSFVRKTQYVEKTVESIKFGTTSTRRKVPGLVASKNGSLNDDGICVRLISSIGFPAMTAPTQLQNISVPVTGTKLHAHVYVDSASNMLYSVKTMSGSISTTQAIANTGWQWITIDCTQYMDSDHYVTFYTRANTDAVNYADVYWWEG